jgi:hypothetical protein
MRELMGRLSDAVDRDAKAERARAELKREVQSLREGSFQQLAARTGLEACGRRVARVGVVPPPRDVTTLPSLAFP